MQIIRKIQIGLVLVVFLLLSLTLPSPTEAGICAGDCTVKPQLDCSYNKIRKKTVCKYVYFSACGGNGCEQVSCPPGTFPISGGGCRVIGPVATPKPDLVEPPPPPPPPCDANAWGAWSACSVTCGGGTRTRTNACGTIQGQTCNTQSCQGPWWQVKDGDITTSGNIISEVPAGYYLNTVGAGGFPGIPVYGGSIGTAPGTISTKLWNANTETSLTRIFNYSYFENLIPDGTVFNNINKLTTGVGVTLDAGGYEWYKVTGNLDTVGNIDFGSRKIILFIRLYRK